MEEKTKMNQVEAKAQESAGRLYHDKRRIGKTNPAGALDSKRTLD